MQRVLIGAAMMLALSGCAHQQASVDTASLKQEGRQLAARFLGSLKPELQKAMKAGGPTHAIEVCHVKAPQITRQLSQESGWQLRRTSLKVRNPDNAPDAWERRVLAQFEQQKAQGADPRQLEYGEVVTENGQRVWRYAKAIPTGPVCTVCHGQKVAPPVMEKIRTYYPSDQATGFKPGDIRGMFSFRKVLDD